MRGLVLGEDANETWQSLMDTLLSLFTGLRHIEFGQCPVSVLHTVINQLSQLKQLTVEFITDDISSDPRSSQYVSVWVCFSMK